MKSMKPPAILRRANRLEKDNDCLGLLVEVRACACEIGRLRKALETAPELLAACLMALPFAESAISAGCDDPETEASALRNHAVLAALRAAVALATGE